MHDATHTMKPTPYASSADFCRIFYEETERLYLLSFLLTADPEQAEQCFASGLEDSVEEGPVFKEWACWWARWAIIRSAVRVIKPRPMVENASSSCNWSDKKQVSEQAEIAAVLELRPFERFVFVMSVLERYSDQDCSDLLGRVRQDVIAARIRALRQIGRAAKFYLMRRGDVDSARPDLRANCDSVRDPRLAIPA
jgi:hypothetical protein